MCFPFTPSLLWSSAQQKRAAQAQRAIFSTFTLTNQRQFGHVQPTNLFSLFDALVKPSLLYGSGVGFVRVFPKSERINIKTGKDQ